MRYNFTIVGEFLREVEGSTEGHDPRDAMLNALRSVTDVLDECEGPLAPTIDVSRVGDGLFEGEVDTHGLGGIAVRLERVS